MICDVQLNPVNKDTKGTMLVGRGVHFKHVQYYSKNVCKAVSALSVIYNNEVSKWVSLKQGLRGVKQDFTSSCLCDIITNFYGMIFS